MQINKKWIKFLLIQLIIIIIVGGGTHSYTAQNYKKIGENSGIIDGKYQAINQITKFIGEIPKCNKDQYSNKFLAVKGDEIFFAGKNGNFVSFCRM